MWWASLWMRYCPQLSLQIGVQDLTSWSRRKTKTKTKSKSRIMLQTWLEGRKPKVRRRYCLDESSFGDDDVMYDEMITLYASGMYMGAPYSIKELYILTKE